MTFSPTYADYILLQNEVLDINTTGQWPYLELIALLFPYPDMQIIRMYVNYVNAVVVSSLVQAIFPLFLATAG